MYHDLNIPPLPSSSNIGTPGNVEQQQINYGSRPNDGQGDPLRTAFVKTDDNFDAIWAAGPVGSNVTIMDTTVAVTSTNGNLVLKPNGIGAVQANASVLPNTANIRDLGSSSQRWRSAWVGVGGLNVTGNVTSNSTVQAIKVVTVPAVLAALVPESGARAFVSDGNLSAAGNFGAQIGAGGANTIPVWSDGVKWYIG